MAEYFDCICVLYAEDVLEDEEFIPLLEEITRPALELPYWKFPRLNLADISEDECLTEFRFEKEDIPRLARALRLPPKFVCSNGTTANDIESLCLLLRRFAYPCRYSDLIPRFGRSIPEMSQIMGEIMGYISTTFGHLLRTFNQPWLQPNKLEEYAQAVYRKSSALDNCWGFVDGTVRPICRPQKDQRVVYNGHKRVHALKFQSVVAANGLIANLYGPVGK